MTRRTMLIVLAIAVLAGTGYWVSTRTEWVDIDVPMPARGEARTNQTYAAQRFVEALGAHATRDLVFAAPPPASIVMLSAWTWDLSPARREALERWVESGGRLVVDSSVRTNAEFRRWSGIGFDFRESDDDGRWQRDQCRPYDEQRMDTSNSDTSDAGADLPASAVGSGEARRSAYARRRQVGPPAAAAERRRLCDFDEEFFLTTTRPAEWALRDAKKGLQVARVRVGRGSVTSLNGDPFRARRLFDGDHGWLLVKAAELRPGDEVHFLSEGDYPSLLALTWQRGEPVVLLSAVLVALLLWRGGVRFGPLAAPAPAARRSLAEQIRGTGHFARHHGGGAALHAASVRALDEAARTRIAGYEQLQAIDRTDAVARLTGIGAAALAAAVFNPRARRPHELRATVALVETARRRLIVSKARSTHGN